MIDATISINFIRRISFQKVYNQGASPQNFRDLSIGKYYQKHGNIFVQY